MSINLKRCHSYVNHVMDRNDGLDLKVEPASVASQLLARVARKMYKFTGISVRPLVETPCKLYHDIQMENRTHCMFCLQFAEHVTRYTTYAVQFTHPTTHLTLATQGTGTAMP